MPLGQFLALLSACAGIAIICGVLAGYVLVNTVLRVSRRRVRAAWFIHG